MAASLLGGRFVSLKIHSKEKHAKIKKLLIAGHGNDYHIWIGLNLVNVSFLKNPNEPVTKDLAQLKDLLADDAVIVLRGCEVGKNQELMRELSRVVGGAKVQATTIEQNCLEPELEGPA